MLDIVPVRARVLAEFRSALSIDDLDADDNYFEHGGDSLGALRLVGRLRATLDPELRMIDLFRHPTAGALSTTIVDRSRSRFSSDA